MSCTGKKKHPNQRPNSSKRRPPQNDHFQKTKPASESNLRNRPRPTRNRLPASLAAPDTDAVSFDGRLAAERAHVAGVLADFHLLDLFAEGGAVSVLRYAGLVS